MSPGGLIVMLIFGELIRNPLAIQMDGLAKERKPFCKSVANSADSREFMKSSRVTTRSFHFRARRFAGLCDCYSSRCRRALSCNE